MNFRAVSSIYRFEMARMRRTLVQSIVAPVLSTSLYFVIFGAAIGSRITDMTLLKSGEKIDPAKNYVVAGWASVNEGAEGPPIWDVVANYVKRKKTVSVEPNTSVKVEGV